MPERLAGSGPKWYVEVWVSLDSRPIEADAIALQYEYTCMESGLAQALEPISVPIKPWHWTRM